MAKNRHFVTMLEDLNEFWLSLPAEDRQFVEDKMMVVQNDSDLSQDEQDKVRDLWFEYCR